MKSTFNLVVIVFATLMLASSPASAQDSTMIASKTVDTSAYATIYIYRPRNFTGSAINYNIHLDDTVVCRIKNNTKYSVKVYKEGPAVVWAETEQKRKLNINVKFGQEYFVKCGITMGMLVGRPEINLVYPEQGRMDYDNLEARNTKGKEKSK